MAIGINTPLPNFLCLLSFLSSLFALAESNALTHLEHFEDYDLSILKSRSVVCYDDDDKLTKRVHLSRLVGSGLDTQNCKSICEESNYQYAERLREGECWCGNHLNHLQYRKVRSCDCFSDNVEERKSCVFLLNGHYVQEKAGFEETSSVRIDEGGPRRGAGKGICRGKNCSGKPGFPSPTGRPTPSPTVFAQKHFTMPLNIELADESNESKNDLLQNPILKSAFDLITKDWLNECVDADCFLYTHANPSNEVHSNMRSLRKSEEHEKGKVTAASKGLCKIICTGWKKKNCSKCPKPINEENIVNGFSQTLTTYSSNNNNACDKTLLDRLRAYQQPPHLSEGFQNVFKLHVTSDNNNAQTGAWTSEACDDECQTLETIYDYYGLERADSHNVCTWKGIACDSELQDYKIFVENLSSSNRKAIHEDIADLPGLKDLSLVRSGLTGTLPSNIGKIPKLLFLDVSSNNIGGTIPPEYGQLKNVEIMQLQDNSIRGSIPDSFGQLNELEYLDVRNNELTGTLPKSLCLKAITSGNKQLTVDCGGVELIGRWPSAYKKGYITGLWRKMHHHEWKEKTEIKKAPVTLQSKMMCSVDNDRTSQHLKCHKGHYVTGVTRKNRDKELDKMKCCKPEKQTNEWGSCYEQSVEFPRSGSSNVDWQQCNNGYYLAGFGFTRNGCYEISCVSKMHCCQMGRVNVRKYSGRGKCMGRGCRDGSKSVIGFP